MSSATVDQYLKLVKDAASLTRATTTKASPSS